MKNLFGILVTFLFLMSSCDPGVVYKHKAEVAKAIWEYTEPLSFEIPVGDTTVYYELIANIEYSPEFSYENFYVKIITEFPSRKTAEDIVSFQLANKMGSWLADCNNNTCSSELILQDRFRFKEIGNHQFIIENFSREPLNGIQAIEIKVYDISKM